VITRRVILGVMLTCLLGGPATAPEAATTYGGSGKITLTGRMGRLRFNRASEADVAAFAGNPFATSTAKRAPGEPDSLAMGYHCQEQTAAGLYPVDRFDYCRTVFFINDHTHRLAAFYSASSRYSFRGATPGMSTAEPRSTSTAMPWTAAYPDSGSAWPPRVVRQGTRGVPW
jgi:hypothetical protein